MTAAANSPNWLLNSLNGWRLGAPSTGLLERGDGSLALQTLPGEAQPFSPDLTGVVSCPAALVGDDCGRVWVLDAAADRVFRIDPSGTIHSVVEFGGTGAQPRQFRGPRGLAVVNGSVVVCDTGNNRVQVFSPAPHALTQLWGRADGAPGTSALEFHWPWGIAYDPSGHVYVADRGNGRVQKIALDGAWLATLGAGVLTEPTDVAVGPNGIVAVVDGSSQPSGGSVQVFAAADGVPTVLPRLEQPRTVAFDPDGNLYVGTAKGLVFHFAPDSTKPRAYKYVGAGITGLDAAAVHMVWITGKGLLGIFQDSDGHARRLGWIPVDGARVCTGHFITETIDSGIEDCPWDRITLIGSIPEGASVKVECFTAARRDDLETPLPNPQDGPPFTFVGEAQKPSRQALIVDDFTCLVQAQPGQYLRLKVSFRSGGQSTPVVSAVRIFFPRQSYLQYLPAVYQQDDESRDFLDRFLSIFQATFDQFDATIDSVWRLFDPDSVPPQLFDWLAAWLQFPTDPAWELAKKRTMLKRAVTDYRKRGTVAGLTQAVSDYAGFVDGVAIVEHFRLRKWPLLSVAAPLGGGARLWGRQFYRRLQVGTNSHVGAFSLTGRPEPAAEANDWGANEFSVFFPADPYNPAEATAKVAAVVEREKPAHTRAYYVPVLPRFRVGVQATIGVDTRVGGHTQLVLGSLSRLGYDAILARSPALRDLEGLGTSARPITGVNTRLH
jgi:phage tail-like protein